MNICPHCNSIITYLVVSVLSSKNTIMKDKSKTIFNINIPQDEYSVYCSCPDCEETLFENDPIKAKEFIEKI